MGTVLPSEEGSGQCRYAAAIAHALRLELGASHRAMKTLMSWTGASERTVKNWLAGTSGPSGAHLIQLARRSDHVFKVFLELSEREEDDSWRELDRVRVTLRALVEELATPRGSIVGTLMGQPASESLSSAHAKDLARKNGG